MRYKLAYFSTFMCIAVSLTASSAAILPHVNQDERVRPFIWVSDSDHAAVLEKIRTQPWAASVFEKMKEEVDHYVDQHVTDPSWILSRLPMTWGGPNYTDVHMENGRFVYSGNAPYPTFRFMEGGTPRSPDGKGVALPTLEEIPPFNSNERWGMTMTIKGTTNTCFVNYPDLYIREVTRPVLVMAVDSSVLYWITGDEKYAKFSADILSQLCEGLFYMNPSPEKVKNTNWGLISRDHLLEARWFSSQLPIIYDFVEPYLRKGGLVYDAVAQNPRPINREHVQGVFTKYAQLTLDRGICGCNWVVFEACSLVNNALALDDPAERNRYMSYFLTKDTDRQQSMATVMQWFTADDFWPETLRYGVAAIQYLTYLSSVADQYNPSDSIFQKYPVLFKAPLVLPRFQFPNGEYIRFGDSPRKVEEDVFSYEMIYRIAEKSGNDAVKREAAEAIKQLIAAGKYDRSAYEPPPKYVYYRPLKLLWFSPEIAGSEIPLNLSRTDALTHAGLILQRNAVDAEHGMMCWQGGAAYVHSHSDGINMELYGAGKVVGADGGAGDYGSEIHREYYRLHAAHNTVIVNNASRGIGGWVNSGQDTAQVISAEPTPRTAAVSPECSFAMMAFTNRYGADAKPADQQRMMALIRTTPATGYYVDVFRSRTEETNQFHDYLYHNIGDVMQLTGDFERKPAPDWFGSDIGDEYRQPGTRWFVPQYSTGLLTNTVKATFQMAFGKEPAHTCVWFPAGTEREYVSVLAPPTLEAPSPYWRTETPVVVARRHGEAWEHPFAAVYEVYRQESGASVQNVSTLSSTNGLTILRVESETPDGHEVQTVFSADRSDAEFSSGDLSFKGRFAVCSEVNGALEYIYFGDAASVQFRGWAVAFKDGRTGALDVRFHNGVPLVTSAHEAIIKTK